MTEPVAFFDPQEKGFYWAKPTKITAPTIVDVEPLALYTQRTWEGFTEEEFVYFCSFVDHDILDQIENVLREKNELR